MEDEKKGFSPQKDEQEKQFPRDFKEALKETGRKCLDEILEKEKHAYRDIPHSIFKFFKTDATKVEERDFKKFKEISDWAFADDASLDEGIKKLRKLEIKLGEPSGNQDRWYKIWNFIKMERAIDDLKKKQEAI